MNDLNTSIRRSSTWIIIRLAITFTVGAFITTYVIRHLTTTDFGIYNVLFSSITYVAAIASFGIPSVIQRFVPEAVQRKQYSLVKRLVHRALALRLLISLAAVVIILIFHQAVGRLLKIPNWIDYYEVFAWGIVLFLEIILLNDVLHSIFLHKYSVISRLFYTLFRGACLFVLLFSGYGLIAVLWAEVASWALWLILQWQFYRNKFLRLQPVSDKISFPSRRYFRYGGLSTLNEFGNSILGVSSDIFVITAFLGPGAVALYAFADRVIRLFVNCMPHIVLIDVIRPSFFTKYAATGNKKHLGEMFNFLMKLGAFFVFPLAANFFALGDKIITIVFKPEYLGAKTILWIMISFAAINVFAQPAGLVLKAVEQVQFILYSKIFAIYNIVVAILVINRFGVLGVVFVTCSAHFMTNLFLYYFARKYADLWIDWRGLSSIIINAMISSICLYAIRSFAINIFSLFVVILVGFCIYLISSYLNKSFSSHERNFVNKVVSKTVFVF